MKLTKLQIQSIDQRLKKGGIKYWDVRIEMVDHLVTDIEERGVTNNFDEELQNALKRANWHYDLDEVNIQSWKNTNRLYRKKFYKEIWRFLISVKGLTLLLLFVCAHYYLSTLVSHKTFMVISGAIFFLPILLYFYLAISTWIKKYGRSVHLDYGLNYMLFSFLMLQGIPQLVLKKASETSQVIGWLILLPLYLVMMYAGYKGFQSAYKKVKQMKQVLNG
jgi:hypothetical protein